MLIIAVPWLIHVMCFKDQHTPPVEDLKLVFLNLFPDRGEEELIILRSACRQMIHVNLTILIGSKIVVSEITEGKTYTLFSVVTAAPDGRIIKERLDLDAYLAIVAATNFKQRIRKMLEYYHADLANYAVAGTPNRLEYDQGFFVKQGDGAADIKPIAHLYKTQVYELARHLGLPEAIINRPPTTDTYSLPQGQDEFFFAVPYETMDLCLYGKNNGFNPEQVAPSVGLTVERVMAVYKDIDRKRAATRYLHMAPVLVGPVHEIEAATGMGKVTG